jgi:hypothetical protein
VASNGGPAGDNGKAAVGAIVQANQVSSGLLRQRSSLNKPVCPLGKNPEVCRSGQVIHHAPVSTRRRVARRPIDRRRQRAPKATALSREHGARSGSEKCSPSVRTDSAAAGAMHAGALRPPTDRTTFDPCDEWFKLPKNSVCTHVYTVEWQKSSVIFGHVKVATGDETQAGSIIGTAWTVWCQGKSRRRLSQQIADP